MKMTEKRAKELAKRGIELSKQYSIPLKKKKTKKAK